MQIPTVDLTDHDRTTTAVSNRLSDQKRKANATTSHRNSKENKILCVRGNNSAETFRGFDEESDESDGETTTETAIPTLLTSRNISSVQEKNLIMENRTNQQLFDDLLVHQNKLEKRFLQPLMVSIKRQSETLNEVIETQKKVIRALRRRKVNIRMSNTSKYAIYFFVDTCSKP